MVKHFVPDEKVIKEQRAKLDKSAVVEELAVRIEEASPLKPGLTKNMLAQTAAQVYILAQDAFVNASTAFDQRRAADWFKQHSIEGRTLLSLLKRLKLTDLPKNEEPEDDEEFDALMEATNGATSGPADS